MKTASKVAMISIAAVLATGAAAVAVAKHLHGGQGHAGHGHSGMMAAAHAGAAAVSYTELKNTVAELDRAKQATEKYQDVRVAQAEGYQILGAEFPGMGAHFVLNMEPKGFQIEKPPILLYHKSADTPGGYKLVGVSYLYDAPAGPDAQPVNPPFPKALARWHQHDNICMLAGLDNPHGLTESECREKGGHFIAKSQWLVHAWIWTDNPAGVFTPENPALR
jgi:hypothetical protein